MKKCTFISTRVKILTSVPLKTLEKWHEDRFPLIHMAKKMIRHPLKKIIDLFSCWLYDINQSQGTYVFIRSGNKNGGIVISYQHHEECQKNVDEKKCKPYFSDDVL